MRERLSAGTPFAEFAEQVRTENLARVPGTAVFMYSDPIATPPALLRNLRYNHVLHETVILLSVIAEEVPIVPPEKRVECRELEHGFYQVDLRYGIQPLPTDAPGLY